MIKVNIESFPANNSLIKNINISINDGEIIGIAGPPESCKSLLLSCIYGKLSAEQNLPFWKRVSSNNINRDLIASTLSQSNPYNTNDTLWQYLLSSLNFKKKLFSPHLKESKDTVISYSDRFNMSHLLNRKLSVLTDSQMKLAKIIFTFVREAELMLLDNAFTSLDLNGVQCLQREIKRYTATGKRSVVLSDHDLTYLFHTADSVYFMHNGTISEHIDPNDITADIIRKYFGVEVLISRNIYSGRPQVHLFPRN